MRVLSVDGGGYLGLASAVFLESMEQRFGVSIATRFDLFCGTSTGAIIALALALGIPASRIVRLYEELGPRVFGGARTWRFMKWWFSTQHDNRELRSALVDVFEDATLGSIRQRGKKALVTSFNLTQGRPTIFKTDHGTGLSDHDDYRVVDIALASSAAPLYLPFVVLTHPRSRAQERYCDGGVVANSPALLGYAEALFHLGADPGDVSVLSVGTPRESLAEPLSALPWYRKSLRRGVVAWRERILTVVLDGGASASHETLRRLCSVGRTRYSRVSLAQPSGLALDLATHEATETLRHIGADRARNAATIAELTPFFVDQEA